MNPWRVWRLRKAWKHAQTVHDEEHETRQPLTYTCEAVGHSWLKGYDTRDNDPPVIDDYSEYFDKDAQRHFLREYRGAL